MTDRPKGKTRTRRARAVVKLVGFTAAVLALFDVGSGQVPTCEEEKLPVGSSANGTDNARMGEAVAIDGDYAVVGAPKQNEPSTQVPCNCALNAGVAYVYERDDTAPIWERWTFQDVLVHPSPMGNDLFGQSVAISDDTAIVGAPFDSTTTGGSPPLVSKHGSAHIFVRSGQTWSLQASLTAPSLTAEDWFGWAVDIDGDTAVVCAVEPAGAGTCYVFARSGAAWTLQASLAQTSGDDDAGDNFGTSVAIDGDTIFVGAKFDDEASNPDSGAAYVFERSGTTWSAPPIKLLPIDLEQLDNFGCSVSLSLDTAVVGACLKDAQGAANTGQAYVYSRAGSTWNPQPLIPAQAIGNSKFGKAVSIDGPKIAVGTSLPTTGEIAYVYEKDGTAWAEQDAVLSSSRATSNAHFGVSVGISSGIVVVGALNDANVANQPSSASYPNSGSAYVFAPSSELIEFYCVGKTSSISATCGIPFLTTEGVPSLTDSGAFDIIGNDIVVASGDPSDPNAPGTKSAVIIWGVNGRMNKAFHGGTQCVNDYMRLTKAQWAIDIDPGLIGACDQVIRWDYNELIQAGTQPELLAGERVNAQMIFWDPNDPAGFDDGLTDAVEFVICP